MRLTRSIAFALALVLLATACSSSDSDAALSPGDENYVGFDDSDDPAGETESVIDQRIDEGAQSSAASQPASEPGARSASDGVLPGGLTDEDQTRLLGEVNAFMEKRDLIVVGEAGIELLGQTVSPEVRNRVEAEQTVNLDAIAEYENEARFNYRSTPSLLEGTSNGDLYRATVCTDRRGERWSGTTSAVALREDYVFEAAGDEWTLVSIETDHDGEYGTPGLTCVPQAVAEAATESLTELFAQIEAVYSEPSLFAATDFSASASRNVQYSIEQGIGSLPQDQRRVTTTLYEIDVQGIYPDLNLPSYHTAVSVCRRYPDGAFNEVASTGERVLAAEGLIPGASVEDRYIVIVDADNHESGTPLQSWAVQVEKSTSVGC